MHSVTSRLENTHQTEPKKPSSTPALLIVLRLIGILGLVLGAVGIASYGHYQGWWNAQLLSNIGETNSIILMAAGGGGGVLLLTISIIGRKQKSTPSQSTENHQKIKNLSKKDPPKKASAPITKLEATVRIQKWWRHNFSKQALYRRYQYQNRNFPSKTAPLKIVHVAAQGNLDSFLNGLNEWLKLDKSQPHKDRDSEQGNAVFMADTIIKLASKNGLRKGSWISYLVDNQNQIQAFCNFNLLDSQTQTWDIAAIATAPQNVWKSAVQGKAKFSGCGSALIADIFHRFKAKTIELASLDTSLNAYMKMGFIVSPKKKTILTGKNMMRFIVKYSGRVLS